MLLWNKKYQDLIYVVACLISGTWLKQNYQWHPVNTLNNCNNNWKHIVALEILTKLWKISFNRSHRWSCSRNINRWCMCISRSINRSHRQCRRGSINKWRGRLLKKRTNISCKWCSISSTDYPHRWCSIISVNWSHAAALLMDCAEVVASWYRNLIWYFVFLQLLRQLNSQIQENHQC